MWVQKYKPKNLKEFINQKEVVEIFLRWIKRWKPRSKALLFYGIPGVGKTALIEAWCSQENIELIQMNASDFRNKNQIEEVLGRSILQLPLFKKTKLFFLDEIDGIAGREDLGGVGAIIKIIKESRFPIVLTANNVWDSRLKSLRNYCQLVEFKKIYVWDIEKRLKEICEKEKIKYDKNVLKEIAKLSTGDLRSAINDLETISWGKGKIGIEDLNVSYRERGISIFNALNLIFKTKSALAAKLSISNVDKDPEEIFWWIENNIVNEYETAEEIAKAYDALSKADLFRQWITSRQNWRLKSYMIDLMTAGIATAKKDMYRKFTRYQYPSNLIVLGRSKKERASASKIFHKLSVELHCSSKKIKKEFLPFFKIILKNKETRNQFVSHLNITKDELSILK